MATEEMTIRTLVSFEQDVIYYIRKMLRCTNEIAEEQALKYSEFIGNCYKRNDTAKQTAEIIFRS